MANRDQFDETHAGEMDRPAACLVCEAMLPDAVDGTLSAADQKVFDRHVAGCTACGEELAEAQRGAAWLQMLKGHAPEPSASLLTRILGQTSRAEVAVPTVTTPNVVMMPAMLPQVSDPRPAGKLLMFRQKMSQMFSIENSHLNFQPRLAMTAAMAFFSIALTLNMTGVKLSSFRASNFTPSGLRRSVADTTASASRSFHNMRVVYQVESRLEDMRSDDRSEERMHSAAPYSQPTEPANNGQKQDDSQKQQETPKGHSSVQFPVIQKQQRVTEEGV